MGWALHAWGNEPQASPDRYYAVVELLVTAGAAVNTEWLEQPTIRADARMLVALSRATT